MIKKVKKRFFNLRISALICVLLRKEFFMRKKLFYLCNPVLISTLFLFVIGSSVYAESVENIKVIKISPQDERAVIRTTDRKLQIIKVGDVIRVPGYRLRVNGQRKSGLRVADKESAEFKVHSSEHRVQGPGRSELRVIEITSGRVVFEERTERGIETVIVRVEDGKQRIERIRKVGEELPILYRPK